MNNRQRLNATLCNLANDATDRYNALYNNSVYTTAALTVEGITSSTRSFLDRVVLLQDAALALCGDPMRTVPQVDWTLAEVQFLALFL